MAVQCRRIPVAGSRWCNIHGEIAQKDALIKVLMEGIEVIGDAAVDAIEDGEQEGFTDRTAEVCSQVLSKAREVTA